MKVSILESVLTTLMCEVHFVIRLLLMPITSFILKSVHLFVMLVANRSDSRNILADTFPSTV